MKNAMPFTLPSDAPNGKGLPRQMMNRMADENTLTDVSERLPELAAGVAILGADASISSWNPQAAAMTGYTLEQVRHAGVISIFEPEEVIRHIVRKGCSGAPTLNEHLELRHADGHLRPVVVQCAPQRQLRQSACHVVLVFRTLDASLENLRQDEHFMVMGRFASSLSHEIRNQLNAMMLHTDILDDALQDVAPETQPVLAESVEDIRQEISRLHNLVENFLSMARLSRLDLEPVMLDVFFASLRDEIEPLLSAQDVHLYCELDADLGEAQLHENTFRHLWFNLIHNAIEAMPDGGKLTLQGQRSAAQVSLTITDTGNGIADEQLPLLFVPFHSNKPNGAGLGLYIVQEIAAAHDGWIDVSSELGAGASFTLTLPVSEPRERAADAE